jgi:hypothetical protein
VKGWVDLSPGARTGGVSQPLNHANPVGLAAARNAEYRFAPAVGERSRRSSIIPPSFVARKRNECDLTVLKYKPLLRGTHPHRLDYRSSDANDCKLVPHFEMRLEQDDPSISPLSISDKSVTISNAEFVGNRSEAKIARSFRAAIGNP